MAGTIKGITIQIEGKTSGLVKSLQDVESQIKKDDAALKNLDKALKLDPTNVDLLAAKEQVLADKTSLVTQKMDILQQVQQDALTNLPEDAQLSASQMAELETEIAMTGNTLNELTGEADNASDNLQEVGDSADTAGEEVEESSESFEGLGEAAEVAGEVAVTALEAVVVAAAAVGTAVAGAMVTAGTAMANATMETSKLADEIGTLSAQTGLTTDTIQELNYAAELLDVDTSTVTGSMTKLEKTMGSAASGSKSAQQSFADLGISIKDSNGNLKDADEVFWEAIDALGQIESETERDVASMALFGKSAKELNPLILAGSETFRQLADEAHRTGYVMSSETVDAFGNLDDNMQRLANGAQAVEQSFGQILLPLLTDMSGEAVDLLGDFSGALSEAGGDIDSIGAIIEDFAPQALALVQKYVPKILSVFEQTFNALIPVVMSVAPQLITLAGNLIETLANSVAQNADSFLSAFSSLFESVVDSAITLLPVLVPLAINLIMTLADALISNAPMLFESALSIIMTLCEMLLSPESIASILDSATAIITGLLDGLTTALPILIPAAIEAILTIVDTLLSSGCLEKILSAALTLIVTLATSLIDYLPKLIERLPEIIMGIVKFLTGDALPDIIEAGFTLITAIIGDLPNIIGAIIKALVELVIAMGEYITGEGAEDILKSFQAAFDGIINGAKTWGSDLIKNFISGITSKFSDLGKAASSAAQKVANYLHFSEPEMGPLSDFNDSGADMILNFIDSMNKEQSALQDALNQTAGIIDKGMDHSYDIATQSNITQHVDYSGGLSRIEQAIVAAGASGAPEGSTWVFPIYIGGEHVDTIVLDAIDRNNYTTGGH